MFRLNEQRKKKRKIDYHFYNYLKNISSKIYDANILYNTFYTKFTTMKKQKCTRKPK